MPFYEYRCEDCGQEFEKRLRFDQSEELPPCPHCESSHTKKRLSLVTSRIVPFLPPAVAIPAADLLEQGDTSCVTGIPNEISQRIPKDTCATPV